MVELSDAAREARARAARAYRAAHPERVAAQRAAYWERRAERERIEREARELGMSVRDYLAWRGGDGGR